MAFNPNGYTNLDTVTQQYKSSYDGASSTASSFGLNTDGSSVLGSLNAMGEKLGNAGASVATSVKESLNQLGSFSTVSKFKDKFKLPNAAADLKKPELTKGKTTSPAGNLVYPKDIGPYSITFFFNQYFKDSPLAPKKDRPVVSITLPMPADLVDKFSAQYSSKDLGFLGKVAFESGAFEKIAGGKIDEESAYDLGKKTSGMFKSENIYAGVRSFLGDSTLGTAADRATGTALNPYTALQFQGMGLRKHSFKFKLSPNSRDEAVVLQNIIRAFKERMLPEKNGLLFLVPDSCIITFNTPNVPYSFKTCFLENLTINYAPSGVPSFFKGGEFATEVDIMLEFGETEPVTRDDIEAGGGDITGTFAPYNASAKPAGFVSKADPNVSPETYRNASPQITNVEVNGKKVN